MASTPGFEPGPHWWEASALTTAPPLLPFTLTPRSDWLYQPEGAILIGLDMTRNTFIYYSLKCIHKVTDKYEISIFYLTIALQVSLKTSMQTRGLTADIKLLNWSFDSMRICCLFHTRLRQINPKTGTKTSINSSIHDSTYH